MLCSVQEETYSSNHDLSRVLIDQRESSEVSAPGSLEAVFELTLRSLYWKV